MLQRVGNSVQPGTAALSDVPSEQPHSPTLPVSGSGGKLADIKRRDTGRDRDRYSLDMAKPFDGRALSELTGQSVTGTRRVYKSEFLGDLSEVDRPIRLK
jgi:hypothetical protein